MIHFGDAGFGGAGCGISKFNCREKIGWSVRAFIAGNLKVHEPQRERERLGFKTVTDPDDLAAVRQCSDFPGFHPTILTPFAVAACKVRAKARNSLLAFWQRRAGFDFVDKLSLRKKLDEFRPPVRPAESKRIAGLCASRGDDARAASKLVGNTLVRWRELEGRLGIFGFLELGNTDKSSRIVG